MSTGLGILIMMNNYLHDVATALLFASGIVMLIIMKKFDGSSSPETAEYFLKIYRSISRLALFSLIWIIVGGIPRTIFYKEFEWATAAGKGQIAALIVKHIIAFAAVGSGAVVWMKIHRKIENVRKQYMTK